MTKFFEQRLDEENLKSKKFAWIMFCLMTVIALFLTFTIYHLMPLKRTEVKVLVVDKNTGLPTEITALSDFEQGNVKEMKASQALNKYFAHMYILAHDGYNFYTIRDSYSTVRLHSTPAVFQDYATKFQPPVSIDKQLGDNKTMEPVIHSLVQEDIATPFKGVNDGITMRARVTKQIQSGNAVLAKQTGTILMTFGYDANLQMDEKTRNLNPLGFTVSSYKFTPDMEQGQLEYSGQENN